MTRSHHVQEEAGQIAVRRIQVTVPSGQWGDTDIGREGHRELLGKRRVSCVDEHGSALVKTEHSVCACN